MGTIRLLWILGGAAVAFVLALALGVVFFLVVSQSKDDGHGGDTELAAGTLKVGKSGVPSAYAGLIQKAAADCEAGLSAGVLAAQLKQESNFDPQAGSPVGAQGIAQFMPGTWKTWGRGGDVWDPKDAIPAQGRFMCSLLRKAKNPAKYPNDCPRETVKHPSEYNGSPTELALAGYNAGWCAVDRFAGVPPKSFAKGETYKYVKIIMGSVAELTGPGGELSTSGWARPVDGPLGTPYHQRGGAWSSGMHTGIDFTVPTGTSVKAAGSGTVHMAGQGGAYGNQVVIRHSDGTYSQYGHLSKLSVSAGQDVKGGQKIGLSGATGNVSGPHLHFEIRNGPEYGSDIDPASYLRKRGVKL
ncbi:peptidoglycan DD-metalloendopeptidase family protein (plasmid) [Streptomyces sp. NBC_01186]|uniref:peptidoglycan DD-metalloendopeptidase family protein n=1 Tax=Streptomyces sp. NBC_01186 TaxID=2903765 RepID=UPI002E1466C3|nr:peptidoglycan DD-metalloendopeptidase family protein [Streptomyces sp. NBC_01186]